MTPDELPADMEGVVSEWLGMADEAEAFRSGLKSVVICQTEIDYLRALLKAYQEQRRALSGLLGFMGQLSPLDFVNALYWHETPGLELTTHEELVANLDEAIAAGFAALATRAALNQKGDER